MDTLFHFLFPLICAMAARVHLKHPIRNIIIVALIASVGVDIDHFLGFERVLFHNVFITILLPLVFVVYAFHTKKHYQIKGLSILLLVFLASHVLTDIVLQPGVALFWPISDKNTFLDLNIWIPLPTKFAAGGTVASSLGFIILIYFVLVLVPCYFLDQIILIMERKHESFRKATRDFRKGWKWKQM